VRRFCLEGILGGRSSSDDRELRVAVPAYVRDLRQRVGHDLLLLPGVCGLVFDDSGRLLLGRRADTGTWALIGGIVEPGEEVADAVVREVQEETSVLVTPERITGVDTVADVVYPNHDRVCFVVTTFWCSPLSGRPTVNDDESLEVAYFPLGTLPPLPPHQLRRVEDALRNDHRAAFRRSDPTSSLV
jgi:8-oxo-dGTP pyrophosphatase MutT (NUDIX family)